MLSCKALGLVDSHFTNPSGQHDNNHYSTAHDIAILMQYCMKNTTFKTYASLKSCHLLLQINLQNVILKIQIPC